MITLLSIANDKSYGNLREETLYVSKQKALILRRESEGQAAIFEDYRDVDGERIPFLTTIHDALGETTIAVDSARFNIAIPETAFQTGDRR